MSDASIEETLLTLIAPLTASRLALLIGARQGFIAMLPEDVQHQVGELLKGQWVMLSLVTVGQTKRIIVERRPDLETVLAPRVAEEWLYGELTMLRSLVRGARQRRPVV